MFALCLAFLLILLPVVKISAAEPNRDELERATSQLRVSFQTPTESETTSSPSATISAGSGTEGDPYQISDCDELQAMEDNLSSYYVLTQNIDCSETSSWNSGAGFEPVGTLASPFLGHIDGAGYIISGLYIDRDSTEYVGLIGYGGNSIISDLGLTSADVTGLTYVGVLAGYLGGTATVDNAYSSGSVSSIGNYAGGLIGDFDAIEVTNSHSSVTVTSTGNQIGGLIGLIDSGDVSDSYATGDVTTTDYYIGGLVGLLDSSSTVITSSYATGDVHSGDGDTGGLVAQLYGSTIIESYATGDVYAGGGYEAGGLVGDSDDGEIYRSFATGNVYEGYSEIGGLVGMNDGALIIDCYARGSVTASDEDYGGLVGENYGGDVYNSYATGRIIVDADYYGGLIGYEDGDSYYSFWDTETSETATSDGDEVGKTTAEMKDINTFTTDLADAAWDFDTVWEIVTLKNDGYPSFYYQATPTPSPTPTPTVVGDTDGMSKKIEDAGPNDGDANNDGIPDSQQNNVTSLKSPVSKKYVVLEIDGTCNANQDVSIDKESELGEEDSVYTYPVGFLNFTLIGCEPGGTATVTQYYYGDFDLDDMILRKYNSSDDSYDTVDDVSFKLVTIGGESAMRVRYDITDGEELDQDGEANGTIVDPVGVAMVEIVSPKTGFAQQSQSLAYLVLGTGLLLTSVGINEIRKRENY